jgi:hypothetical protein
MTQLPRRSTRVRQLSWGPMQIEGLGTGKDYKLYAGWRPSVGLVRDWDEPRAGAEAR